MSGKDESDLVAGLNGLKKTVQCLEKVDRARIYQARDFKAQLPPKRFGIARGVSGRLLQVWQLLIVADTDDQGTFGLRVRAKRKTETDKANEHPT